MKKVGRPTSVSADAVRECQRVREARMALPSNRELAQRLGLTLAQIDYAISNRGYKWLKTHGDKT